MGEVVRIIKEVFNILVTLIEFILKLVYDLVKVIALLGETVVNLPEYFGYFYPSVFVSLFVSIISLVVVYKILGREG